MNPSGLHTITAITIILTSAVLQQEQFAAGQPSTGVEDTLCDSNASGTLIAGAVEGSIGGFLCGMRHKQSHHIFFSRS